MLKSGLIVSLLIVMAYESKAQTSTFTLQGTVKDSLSGQQLEGATLTLDCLPGGTSQHRRNSRIGFIFRQLAPGDYYLITSFLGYRSDTAVVRVPASLAKDSSLLIRLQRSVNNLMQVVVTARIPPAIVRNDTIAFNAGAYPTRPNATVEDLLRKLPGIDIDKDGNVTMQGKKVDKIYLDGKEFFLNDPRTASQNLPADIVDQIEAFDSQSDRARLTGIKEMSGTKSINIKLKKNRQHGYFGKAYGGAGEGNGTTAYSAGGTATSLGRKWLFGVGNVNNINNQFTGQENRNGPGGGGIQTFNNFQFNYSNNGEGPTGGILTRRPGIAGSPIAVAGPAGRLRERPSGGDPALTFTLNAGTNGSRNVLKQSSNTQTTLTDSSLSENRARNSINSAQTTQGNANVEYRLDSFSLLTLRSRIRSTSSRSNETDTVAVGALQPQQTAATLLNRGQTINSSRSTNTNETNQLNYRWRGHVNGRTLLVNFSQSASQQNNPQTTYSLVNNLDSAGRVLSQILVHQQLTAVSNVNAYGGGLTYTEPVGKGRIVDASYRIDRSTNRSDRAGNDYDSVTGAFDHPDSGTSNHFTTISTIQRIAGGYNATEGKFRYQLGLTLQVRELVNRNRSTDSTLTIRQINWYPRASLLYNPTPGTSMSLQYSASTTSPTVEQLQPVSDPTNPFLVKLGNPGLEQQLTHAASLEFNRFNSRNFQNLQASLMGTVTEKAITTATTVLAGGIQQNQYINTSGDWSGGGNLGFGFPLGDQRKGNASLTTNGSYSRSVVEVNGVINTMGTIGWGATGKINLHPVDRLFFEAQGFLGYNGSRYHSNTAQPVTTWTQLYSLDLVYTLPGDVALSTWFREQMVRGIGPATESEQWNASIVKGLGRSRAAQVRLSAFGLLNAARNTVQTTTANVTSVTTANLPGRTFLVSFVYYFRKFSAPKPN